MQSITGIHNVMARPKVLVFDNNGETFDRYTILNKQTGDLYGASSDPYHPQGFGQYCGNAADQYWRCAYGAAWRKMGDAKHIKKLEKFAIDKFISEFKDKPISIDQLPIPVQQYIKQVTAD